MNEKLKSKLVLVAFILMVSVLITAILVEAEEQHLITFLHTNDSHSALRPHSGPAGGKDNVDTSLGGIARLAALIEKERVEREAAGETVFLISAGDFHGGDPYAWLALNGEAPEIKLMQELGYDMLTIGNHEYDFGPENLADYLQQAGYPGNDDILPVIASNTEVPEVHPLAQMGLKDYLIKETDAGLKVGFFGIIGNDAVSVAQETGTIHFAGPPERAAEMVNILKEQRVNMIIAVSHSGLEEDRRLAREVGDIDVIIGGHDHLALTEPEMVNDTVIVQAGERFEYLGVLELSYIPGTGKDSLKVLNEENGQPYLVKIDDSIRENEEIAGRVREYTEELNSYLAALTGGEFTDIMKPVFLLDYSLPSSPEMSESLFGDFLTDAMRVGVADITGKPVDFAFEANGLIRSGLKPDKGRISFYQLAAAAGLGIGPDRKPGYPLVEVYLTGKEVKNILEISVLLSDIWGDRYFLQSSGVRYKYDRRRAVLINIPFINKPLPTGRSVLKAEKYTGNGIQAVSSSGNYQSLAINDERLYRVVTDYYLMQFLPQVGEVVPSLELKLKDEQGLLLKNQEDAIIRVDGEELKVWQALFHYADMQQEKLDEVYSMTGSRIIPEEHFSLLAAPGIAIIILLLIIGLVFYLVFRKKGQNKG